MVKKILKNKFFILFVALIILMVTARFSPAYSLNSRLIALAIGLEKEGQNIVVTVEAIKPDKDKTGYQTFSGKGLTISAAIGEIEANSGKKMSLAQCEIVYLSREIIEQNKISYYETKALKELPELAVNVCCDSPKEIIGKKINKENHSFSVGNTIRENQTNLTTLEVNNKDVGRDYLSGLGTVVMPKIEVTEGENGIDLVMEKAVAFNKYTLVDLDREEYIAYLLLMAKSKNSKGDIKVTLGGTNGASVKVDKVRTNRSYEIINGNYIAKYEVYIDYLYNETFIVSNEAENENKRKLTESDEKTIENAVSLWVNKLVNRPTTNDIDTLRIYDKFRAKYQNVVYNDVDFMKKLVVSAKVNLVKKTEK